VALPRKRHGRDVPAGSLLDDLPVRVLLDDPAGAKLEKVDAANGNYLARLAGAGENQVETARSPLTQWRSSPSLAPALRLANDTGIERRAREWGDRRTPPLLPGGLAGFSANFGEPIVPERRVDARSLLRVVHPPEVLRQPWNDPLASERIIEMPRL
jgi:hypothetical protein